MSAYNLMFLKNIKFKLFFFERERITFNTF
jgi:hypothetical protein